MALDRSGRSITAGDVIKAITEMDFGPADHLVPILEQELAGELGSLDCRGCEYVDSDGVRRSRCCWLSSSCA